MANLIGVPRSRQQWVGQDHSELPEDSIATAADVQFVVVDFVQAEDGEVEELFDACKRNHVDHLEKLLLKT